MKSGSDAVFIDNKTHSECYPLQKSVDGYIVLSVTYIQFSKLSLINKRPSANNPYNVYFCNRIKKTFVKT